MANRVFLIHFQPLELYPPVMNDIIYLEKALGSTSINVCTTKVNKSLFTFQAGAQSTTIKRLADVSYKGIMLYVNYFIFYFLTVLHLIIKRPAVVLYFETISSFPAIFYRRYLNKKAAIMVHYHEYTSPAEYREGMRLNRWFHGMEKKSYGLYEWISHMIPERMDLFLRDNPDVKSDTTYLLPNYPPLSWKRKNHTLSSRPLKAVYIGSLSLDTMYLREFAEWVKACNGKIMWDIYSFNFDASALEYLQSLRSPFIQFKNGVKYFDIPTVLSEYNVGIILYKGTVENYVYNAPNKLFEYLSADLDVWLPNVMKGSLPYTRNDCYPKVLALNFTALQAYDPELLFNRSKLPYESSTYFCEQVLEKLKEKMVVLLEG